MPRTILPLEIRILERRLEAGEDTERELTRLRKIRDEKLVDEIPRELLPDRNPAKGKKEQEPEPAG